MPRKRKTIEIEVVKKQLNALLASSYIPHKVKDGVCLALEEILHNAGCYNGFGNLYWRTEGHQLWENDGKPYDNPGPEGVGTIPTRYFGPEYERVYY